MEHYIELKQGDRLLLIHPTVGNHEKDGLAVSAVNWSAPSGEITVEPYERLELNQIHNLTSGGLSLLEAYKIHNEAFPRSRLK